MNDLSKSKGPGPFLKGLCADTTQNMSYLSTHLRVKWVKWSLAEVKVEMFTLDGTCSGALVDDKLNLSSQEVQLYCGVHQAQHCHPGEGRDCPIPLCLVQPHLEHLVQVWVPQH